MFTKPRNIESAFQLTRGICVVVILCAFGFCAYVKYESGKELKRAESKLYVLFAGKVFEAVASDRKENVPVEARDHVRTFHECLFTLAPDEKVIQGNISRSLYLADGSAKAFYDNLRESGYYGGVIAGNISQEIIVDSITLDMQRYPFYFRCYSTLRIIRPSSIVTRNLITEGDLRNVGRSDHNPHGFLIERWATLENRDLKIESR
jgi:conjugative transposon TraK protein